jgi:hypothetical protein
MTVTYKKRKKETNKQTNKQTNPQITFKKLRSANIR